MNTFLSMQREFLGFLVLNSDMTDPFYQEHTPLKLNQNYHSISRCFYLFHGPKSISQHIKFNSRFFIAKGWGNNKSSVSFTKCSNIRILREVSFKELFK